MRRTLARLAFASVTLAAMTGRAEAPPVPEFAAIYSWFDSLGLPDVREKPYVEVRFVVPKLEDGTPYKAGLFRERAAGYLLGEDEKSVTLWTHDWYRLVIPRDELAAGADGKAYRVISLDDTAAKLLERFRPVPRKPNDLAPGPELADPPRFRSGGGIGDEVTCVIYEEDLDPKTQLLLVAWLCRRTGVVKRIDDLEERADELEGAGLFVNSGSVREEIAKTLGFMLHQRLLRSLGSRRVAWTDAQVQAEWLVKHFPDWEGGEEGQLNIAELAAMIAKAVNTTRPADECRRLEAEIAALRKTGGPWRPEHAEYVVYSLRDVNLDADDDALTLLGEMGAVSKSAMIDHIDDGGPTRWVDRPRFGLQVSVASIGQLCWFNLRPPAEIEYVNSTDPPEKRAETKAKLRAALLK
jgi:hypothetical protein